MSRTPICFFVHHQGHDHARRAQAIIRELSPQRPVSVLTADPGLFDGFERDVEIVPLPDMSGAAAPAPIRGAPTMHRSMRRIVDHLDARAVGMLVIDVSAELALLARIACIPAVTIRLHDQRNDPGHRAAYEACTAMLAPFDARLERSDYPEWARTKTFYTGGLYPNAAPRPERAAARAALGLPADREIVLTMSDDPIDTPCEPLTRAAHAAPDTLFVTLGPPHRAGRETGVANLVNRAWASAASQYIAAADIVLAPARDDTVHAIARIGRPYVCAPAPRDADAQWHTAERLDALGAAIRLSDWPHAADGWRALLAEARSLDAARLRTFYSPSAAERAARWLEARTAALWNERRPELTAGRRDVIELTRP